MTKKLPGVYIHLPFCSVHCVYCDFPISTRLVLSTRYYEALLNEIRLNRPSETVDTKITNQGSVVYEFFELTRDRKDSLNQDRELWSDDREIQ